MNSSEQKVNAPLISIVIPCRNEKDYIEKTISSLLGQKDIEGNFEIIIVDGMSNDGTRKILKNISYKNRNVKVSDNIKMFTPFALNIGIKQAAGNYICIMGAHAEYSSDYLSNCLKLMDQHPDVSCVGGPIISKGRNNFSKATAIAMSSAVGVGNAKHRFPEYEGYAEMACFPMFKKEVFQRIGFYDETLIRNQDDEFCFRLRREGGKIFISPIVKSTYYVRDSPVKLFKQYYQYGYWRIAVLQKYKTHISLRHYVPSLFVISLLTLVSVGITVNSLLISLLLPSIYLLALLVYSIKFFLTEEIPIIINFIFSVFILHISYALGFISGLYSRIIKKYLLKWMK